MEVRVRSCGLIESLKPSATQLTLIYMLWIVLLFIFATISFFVRTDSTTVLGCTPPDPYSAPVEEALPLACQPHLLNPAARREQMFGTVQEEADGSSTGTSQFNSMALFSASRGQLGQQAGVARDKS